MDEEGDDRRDQRRSTRGDGDGHAETPIVERGGRSGNASRPGKPASPSTAGLNRKKRVLGSATARKTETANTSRRTMLGSAMRRLRVKYSASSQLATAVTTPAPMFPAKSLVK